jgi:superoxide dismutase, Cu-Zn family
MRIGGSVVFLVDDFPEFCGGKASSPKALTGTPVTIHHYIEDCDAAIKRAADAGATVPENRSPPPLDRGRRPAGPDARRRESLKLGLERPRAPLPPARRDPERQAMMSVRTLRRKEAFMRPTLVLGSGLILAGCAMMTGESGRPGARATAELRDAGGRTVGTATLTERPGGVRIVVQAQGLSPGKHGIHIHAVGRCDPPQFTSAGDHFNPHARKHGLETPEGPHAGDLPNLAAGQDGNARYDVTIDRITLRDGRTSLFDADGSSLVIHEKEDDQRTDPTGNSGDRVACGVIVRG